MALLAYRALPPLVAVAALVGLTLAAGHEPTQAPRAEHVLPWSAARVGRVFPGETGIEPADRSVFVPPDFRDARPWNQGGMVIGMPEIGDRIARNALSDLLSGLFDALRGLGA
jgi:hypothetical protein